MKLHIKKHIPLSYYGGIYFDMIALAHLDYHIQNWNRTQKYLHHNLKFLKKKSPFLFRYKEEEWNDLVPMQTQQLLSCL